MSTPVRALLRGLFIVLPVIITIELARWILSAVEGWLAPALQYLLPENFYFPGLALLTFLLICWLIGASAHLQSFAWMWQLPGKILLRLPGVSQIYGMVHDIFEVMSGKNFAKESVVLVTMPNSDIELIGIVTKRRGIERDKMSALLDSNSGDEKIAVFLPMAYNVGGYLVMVPRSYTRNLDMTPAEALQLVLGGGLGK